MFTPPISSRVRSISPSATKEMPVIAAGVGNCLSLGQGVPAFSTPDHILDAVRESLARPETGVYSLQPGMPALRQAVAEDFQRRRGVSFDPDTEVAITVGAMEALNITLLTLVDRGDEVILPSPAYASFTEQVLLAQGVPVHVSLDEKWQLDPDAVREAVTPKTRAIILCSPSNPTGAVFSDEAVRGVCELARERNVMVIADMTYSSLVYDGLREPDMLQPMDLDWLRNHLVTIFSFSKKYALTGWRVGGLVASAPLMHEIMKVHDATTVCAPTVSQVAALAALSGPDGPAETMRAELERRRDLCCARLDELGEYFDYVRPRGAFYVMAGYRFSDRPSREVAEEMIRQARVITIPGGSYGPDGEGHLRISFGTDRPGIDAAFDRIGEWVRSL